MRVVFMGTPDFAVPTLDAIVAAGHEVLAVVAQPDRPKGRGKQLVSPPTIERARALGLPTRQPRAIHQGPFREWFTTTEIDVAVVVAYGRILKSWHLQAPRFGCINVHASLLPKYRGAAPIHWAVVHGETRTGVCTMLMDEGLDTGDVLLRRETAIGPDETTAELWDRLATMGAALLVQTLDQVKEIVPQPQDHAGATLAPLIDKEDGRVDWTVPARRVHDLVRGMNSFPGAFSTFRGDRLKLWTTRVVQEGGVHGPPGTTIEAGPRWVVACGEGSVELTEAQLPGKRRQEARDLLNGGRIEPGELLGG
ncbi:MAG: methionyl-tRNA formyltransferase [Alphaproteobacteria bacterium]|nr:methionyl-tRNA formyltransferase [Alphaproteobacteria bacterium]